MAAINIRKLEAELWESADLLRQGSKLTSNQYCMPVLGLIFLRYAFGRFKLVEAEIQKNRPVRNGRVLPVEPSDFAEKSALYLPPEARYDYLVNLPTDIASAQLNNQSGHVMGRDNGLNVHSSWEHIIMREQIICRRMEEQLI